MKFAVTVVMFALAAVAQSSVLPLPLAAHAGHALSYTAVHGPAFVPAVAPLAVAAHHGYHGAYLAGGPVLAHGPALTHGAIYSAHGPAIAHHGHAAAIVAPVLAHEGTYVAKTRGAVHTAPLAGHINSAASINLAPAPGTY